MLKYALIFFVIPSVIFSGENELENIRKLGRPIAIAAIQAILDKDQTRLDAHSELLKLLRADLEVKKGKEIPPEAKDRFSEASKNATEAVWKALGKNTEKVKIPYEVAYLRWKIARLIPSDKNRKDSEEAWGDVERITNILGTNYYGYNRGKAAREILEIGEFNLPSESSEETPQEKVAEKTKPKKEDLIGKWAGIWAFNGKDHKTSWEFTDTLANFDGPNKRNGEWYINGNTINVVYIVDNTRHTITFDLRENTLYGKKQDGTTITLKK